MQKITSGSWLIATGVLHNLVGLALGGAVIGSILEGGVLNAATRMDQQAIFWFEVSGLLMMMLGGVMRRSERAGEGLPTWLGWSLLALGLTGAACMPASGFWLVVAQGVWLLVRPAPVAASAG